MWNTYRYMNLEGSRDILTFRVGGSVGGIDRLKYTCFPRRGAPAGRLGQIPLLRFPLSLSPARALPHRCASFYAHSGSGGAGGEDASDWIPVWGGQMTGKQQQSYGEQHLLPCWGVGKEGWGTIQNCSATDKSSVNRGANASTTSPKHLTLKQNDPFGFTHQRPPEAAPAPPRDHRLPTSVRTCGGFFHLEMIILFNQGLMMQNKKKIKIQRKIKEVLRRQT